MKSSTVKLSTLAAAISSALLLTACGGGGGGGGGDDSGGSSAAPVSTITSANATDVAAQTISAADTINSQTEIATDGSLLALGTTVQGKPSGVVAATIRQLYRALETKQANMVVGVSGSEKIPCENGGSYTLSYDVANENLLSSGDKLTLVNSNCAEFGETTNGTFSITFSNVSGTPGEATAWSATMALGFTNYSVVTSSVSETINGTLTLSFNQSGPGSVTYSASSNSMAVTTTKAGTTQKRTISSVNDSGSLASNVTTFRTNFRVVGDLPKLGNNVAYDVKTTTDFKQNGFANPYQGVLTATATDKTSLRLTVVDALNVQIGIDKNGDGTIDETLNKTWAELDSLM